MSAFDESLVCSPFSPDPDPNPDIATAGQVNVPLDIAGQAGAGRQLAEVEDATIAAERAKLFAERENSRLPLQRSGAAMEANELLPNGSAATKRLVASQLFDQSNETIEVAPTAAASKATGGLGVVAMGAGLANMYKGARELWSGKTRDGVTDLATGGTGLAQGAMGALMPFLDAGSQAAKSVGNMGAGAGLAGGVVQSISNGLDMHDNGVTGDNAVGMGTGLSNVLGGGAALLGSAPLAAVGSGGALGLTLGKAANDITEATSKDNFKDAQGNQRTAQAAANDEGLYTERELTGTLGATGAHAVGAFVSAGEGIWNVGENAVDHLFGHWGK